MSSWPQGNTKSHDGFTLAHTQANHYSINTLSIFYSKYNHPTIKLLANHLHLCPKIHQSP